ncbi:MAG: hypothetical protein L3V56_05395 [Candidatus Magnetoovum sp. WYHC-5]|nr:hypothetical protein [Candidatus Magnetoovum sp. WYHC-5]
MSYKQYTETFFGNYNKREKDKAVSNTESQSNIEILMMFGHPILDTLNKSSKPKGVHDIAKDTKITIWNIYKAIPVMKELGFIKVVESDDVTGNYLLEITEKGRNMMASK